ncbi:hypothetical protein BKA81DRAFT_382966 [Phyllosticta paracitricarpa]
MWLIVLPRVAQGQDDPEYIKRIGVANLGAPRHCGLVRLSLMVDRGVVWGQSTNKEIGATEDGLAENNSSGQGNLNVSSAAASLQPEHVFVDTEIQPCARLQLIVSHIQVPGIIVPAIHTDDTCKKSSYTIRSAGFASQGRFECSVGKSIHRGG